MSLVDDGGGKGKRRYDSTLARMAGNIAAGIVRDSADADPMGDSDADIARRAVALARAILAELEPNDAAVQALQDYKFASDHMADEK